MTFDSSVGETSVSYSSLNAAAISRGASLWHTTRGSGYPSRVIRGQLWFEGTGTIARSTQFPWPVASDHGLCGITVAGVNTRFGVILLIPRMVCHFCIERGFNAELFQNPEDLSQHPIKLTEVLGFKPVR